MIIIENNQVFSDSGSLIHRIGSDSFFKIATTLPGDSPDMFEEGEPPLFSDLDYRQEVRRLIAEKYTLEDELAIHRQRESKPQQWQDYNEFCEQCKSLAIQSLTALALNSQKESPIS